MNMGSVGIPFLMTLLAGLSTGIGGLSVFFSRKPKTSFLSISLGFSAGVMIYVSMIEIFPQAEQVLGVVFSPEKASCITAVSFFAGMGLIMLIDALIPEKDNPHEPKDAEDFGLSSPDSRHKLLRMGLMSALAIGIHNFPEGLATFMSSVHDTQLGITIAFAIAIHNIPEGIAVAVPVFYSTRNRRKAFGLSLLSGLAEPVGGLIGFMLLYLFAVQTGTVTAVFGIVFAAVAGIMVYISLDELLPMAEKYGKHHYSVYGLIAGMMTMAVSLLLFE